MKVVCSECAGFGMVSKATMGVRDCGTCFNIGGKTTKNCGECSGSGQVSYTEYNLVTCPTCRGKGRIDVIRPGR